MQPNDPFSSPDDEGQASPDPIVTSDNEGGQVSPDPTPATDVEGGQASPDRTDTERIADLEAQVAELREQRSAATGSAGLDIVRLDDPELGGPARYALRLDEGHVIDLPVSREYQLETFPV